MKTKHATIAQSISGGMDSTCLLIHHLARDRDVHLLSFDYGQKHKLELERLDANLAYLESVGLGDRIHHTRLVVPFGQFAESALTSDGQDVPRGFYEEENMKQTVVPNRNAIFSSMLFSLALSVATRLGQEVSISLGVHSGDHAIYPDCREDFFQQLHAAFQLGNWGGDQVRLSLPYIDGDKETILRGAVQDCAKLGIDFDTVLRNTNTSYAPTSEGKADGGTGSDVERILAFHAIGRVDPVEYVEPWDVVLANALQSKAEFEKRIA